MTGLYGRVAGPNRVRGVGHPLGPLRRLWGQAARLGTVLAPLGLWPAALAAQLPPGAVEFGPLLVQAQQAHWPEVPEPWTLAGQVEQESCLTLRHRRCWNPRAELKTTREYGFGFGQITVAYRADGSTRFNKFHELVTRHLPLKDWSWEDRYDPARQLTAMVLMDRDLYRQVQQAATPADHMAFALAAYNGGAVGVAQDRLLCKNTAGCDPGRWVGHVEHTSLKSRTKLHGYGKSFFEINREYVRNILTLRRVKYRGWWA